jgi:hypothetical protein
MLRTGPDAPFELKFKGKILIDIRDGRWREQGRNRFSVGNNGFANWKKQLVARFANWKTARCSKHGHSE